MKLVFLALVCSVASAARAEPLDDRVVEFLAAPKSQLKKTRRGFRIIALSNLAEYCAAQKDSACLERLVTIALTKDVSPFSSKTLVGEKLDGHGLYLSHLNIVLGAYESIAKDGKHRELNERVASHLARATLASKTKHIASYPSAPDRWPADQTATLYSLHLFDQNFAATISREPIRAFLEWSDRYANESTWGLPKSEITGRRATSNLPRGCALSFSVRYLAPFAPERAQALWTKYRDVFGVDYGVVTGMREWPPGIDRSADIDSGPIVSGIGTAASALAIGAAKAVGDDVAYARLVASAAMAKALLPGLDESTGGILATSIELAGQHLSRVL